MGACVGASSVTEIDAETASHRDAREDDPDQQQKRSCPLERRRAGTARPGGIRTVEAEVAHPRRPPRVVDSRHRIRPKEQPRTSRQHHDGYSCRHGDIYPLRHQRAPPAWPPRTRRSRRSQLTATIAVPAARRSAPTRLTVSSLDSVRTIQPATTHRPRTHRDQARRGETVGEGFAIGEFYRTGRVHHCRLAAPRGRIRLRARAGPAGVSVRSPPPAG